MARVDVVIPCYKYAHFLRGAVESVLSQPVDVRVLVIDDCSPDNTAEVAAQLASEDPRVQFSRHAVNRGHIATYNEGLLDWAASEYCVLMSADDMLAPGALGRSVRQLDRFPDAGMAYGRVIRFQTEAPPNTDGFEDSADSSYTVYDGKEWLAKVCDCGNLITSPEAVVRTSVQHRVGGYNSALPHTADMEMWMRIAIRSNVIEIDADQAFYRVHSENMHKRLIDSGLTELEECKAAFDSAFDGRSIDTADFGDLRQRAAASTAYRALQFAYSTDQPQSCRRAFNLAMSCYPEASQWPIYRSVIWKLRISPKVWSSIRRLLGKPNNNPDTSAIPFGKLPVELLPTRGVRSRLAVAEPSL